MAKVRLFSNPKKRRKLFGAALTAWRRSHKPKRRTMNAKRRSNAGQVAWVNPHKPRRANGRKRNSVVVFSGPPRRRSNPRTIIRYKRRGNPSMGDVKGLVESALYAGVGGVLARSIPGSIMTPEQNSGLTGYAANAATGLGLGFIVGKMAGENAGKMVMIGAAVQVIGRIVSDKFGQDLVTFGQVNIPGLPKLSGDPAFNFNRRNMRGDYANVRFQIPYSSNPSNTPRFDYPAALPAAPVTVAAASGGKMAGPWGGGRSGWVGR